MFSSIKIYLYGAVMFIITALGVWVKMLSEQKKSLQKDVDLAEQNLKQAEHHNDSTQEVRVEEQTQAEIATEGEENKDQVTQKVEKQVEESNLHDVKVTL